jgi:hypothetical protein
VLEDDKVVEWQTTAIDALSRAHELGEASLLLATAVLSLPRDRDSWKRFAERVAPGAAAANGEGR